MIHTASPLLPDRIGTEGGGPRAESGSKRGRGAMPPRLALALTGPGPAHLEYGLRVGREGQLGLT